MKKHPSHIDIPTCEICGQEMQLEKSKAVNFNSVKYDNQKSQNKRRVKRYKCPNDDFRITVFSVSTLTGKDSNYRNKLTKK